VGVDVQSHVEVLADVERRRVVAEGPAVADEQEVRQWVAVVGAVGLDGLGALVLDQE
jgi:hypothetical protein